MRNEPSKVAMPATPTPTARTWSVLLNSFVVMVGFVLSRVLGLIRDSVFGNYFGTSEVADAYKAAFNLPDLLYLVIIGGALGSAFIPVFSELRQRDGEARAWELTNTVLTLALGTLAAVSALIFILARPLLGLIYPHFTPAQLALTVYLTRIFLLSPLLLGLGGLAMAALNAIDRFTLSALAPTIYNVAIIVGIVVLAPWFGRHGLYRYPESVQHSAAGAPYSIEGVAWGVVIGAVAYLLVQLPGLWQAGFRPRLRFEWRNVAVVRIGKLMGPRVFGQAAMQINLIVMAGIASVLGDGRVAALTQAYQLMLLPHGIFALSLATVMFPQLSRAYAAGDLETLGSTMRSTLRTVLWTVIPAAVGLAVLSVPLVRMLFQRGQFDNTSTALVASALLFYAAALPAFAAAEILIRTFYAMQDTWTPVVAGLLTIGINIALALLFVHGLHLSHAALAGAFAITNNLEALLLLVLLRRKLGTLDPNGRLRRSLRRAVIGAAVMGAVLLGLGAWGTQRYPFLYSADPAYSGTGADLRLLVGWVGLAVVVGAGVYVALAALQGAEEWQLWRERLLRRVRRSR